MQALEPSAFEALVAAGHVPIDLRAPTDFAAGHVPGSVHVPFSPRGFGERVAALLSSASEPPRLLLIGPDQPVASAVWQRVGEELQATGFPPPAGYLAGGVAAWRAAGLTARQVPLLSHDEFVQDDAKATVLDVREPEEWAVGIIDGARRVSLGSLEDTLNGGGLADLPTDQPIVVVCGAGVRSSSAASLLLRHGYTDVTNLIEGMSGWYRQGRPISAG